jgi:hypothetical protein
LPLACSGDIYVAVPLSYSVILGERWPKWSGKPLFIGSIPIAASIVSTT